MAQCPFCGHENRSGILYCEECARTVNRADVLGTRQLNDIADQIKFQQANGSNQFGADFLLVIHVQNAVKPIIVQPQKQIVLGRMGRNQTSPPEVDLTPYDALSKGVSHVHAALNVHGDSLVVSDMGSVNGTYLNGQRLAADSERVIANGDELQLGKLILQVYFQHQDETTSSV